MSTGLGAIQEVDLAELHYKSALESGDNSAALIAQIDLLQKKYDANDAYRAAGMAILYPDVE